MPAGIVPTVTQVANDPIIQMKTATFLEFNKWFFAWQMTAVIEVFIIGAIFFLLRPFIPFVISKVWTHLPVVGVMTKVRNVVPLGGFTLRNGMYRREHGDNVLYFVKKYLGSYFLMDVPFDLAHLDRGFIQDAVKNKYVATLGMMGYKTSEAIDNALTFNGIDVNSPESSDILRRLGFDSYDAAHAVLNPSNLIPTTIIYAPKYSNIPMDAILGYGSDVTPGNIAAQVSDMFEFQKPPAEEDFTTKWLPWIVFMVSLAIAGAIILSQVK